MTGKLYRPLPLFDNKIKKTLLHKITTLLEPRLNAFYNELFIINRITSDSFVAVYYNIKIKLLYLHHTNFILYLYV